MADGAVRVAMWSGPRNISTAMMRSFENRPDCAVWDEPFYAHYLAETGLRHPLASDIIAAYETDWRAVAARATGPVPDGRALFYQKHMTHHILPHMELDCLAGLRHAFLIRDPAKVLPSYVDKRAEVSLADLGFPQQRRLFDLLRANGSAVPPDLDTSKNPVWARSSVFKTEVIKSASRLSGTINSRSGNSKSVFAASAARARAPKDEPPIPIKAGQ